MKIENTAGKSRFYGRIGLLEEMNELWSSGMARLVTCRGRRRIGKWNAIMGLSFENLILNNFRSLLAPLHLDGVQVFSAAPFRRVGNERDDGLQIDLLIQTRKAFVVVEIKRCREIGESVEHEVEQKVVRLKVPRTKSVRTALVYAGTLTKSVRGDGYFDALVDAASFVEE